MKSRIYEYILIFMQGDVFQNSLSSFSLAALTDVIRTLIRFVSAC